MHLVLHLELLLSMARTSCTRASLRSIKMVSLVLLVWVMEQLLRRQEAVHQVRLL
jgi:hypothetical protein